MSLAEKRTPQTEARFKFSVAFAGLFVGGTFAAEMRPMAVAMPVWEDQSWQVTEEMVISPDPRPSRG